MKVFIDSYNLSSQNTGGGVQSKIFSLYHSLINLGTDVELFNKWSNKLAECDILHLVKLSTEYLVEVMYAKQIGKKIIVSAVVPIANMNRIKFELFLARFLPIRTSAYYFKKILLMSDYIITETSKEKQFIIDAYGICKNIVVIPNGISEEILNGDPELFRSKYNVEGDFAIQLGRIDSNKNLLSTIRALKNTNIQLYVIGGPSPSEMEYYNRCIEEAGDNIHFLGWIKHSDPLLASALKAAKVLVLPSHKEIFGNAIFEALANDTNIVATNALPVEEWSLGDSVITIDPSDINSIKDAIEKSMKKEVNPQTKQFVLNEFSFDSIAQKHIDLYKIALTDEL